MHLNFFRRENDGITLSPLRVGQSIPKIFQNPRQVQYLIYPQSLVVVRLFSLPFCMLRKLFEHGRLTVGVVPCGLFSTLLVLRFEDGPVCTDVQINLTQGVEHRGTGIPTPTLIVENYLITFVLACPETYEAMVIRQFPMTAGIVAALQQEFIRQELVKPLFCRQQALADVDAAELRLPTPALIWEKVENTDYPQPELAD